MNPVENPFSPGAGSRPPELAGRDDILAGARVTMRRIVAGRHGRSQMLLGLRGVGKTVLLNEIQHIAEAEGLRTAKIEAPENKKFLEKLAPQIRKLILQIDRAAKVKAQVNEALGALRSFISIFKVKVGDAEISVEPTPGVADSGDLSTDLTDLLVLTAQAARAAKTAVALLIDEVQYLTSDELSALIVALHEVSQKNLPLTVFGAGLPQLATLATEAKSYAERLFEYPLVGPLDKAASAEALREPVEAAGAKWEADALTKIVKITEGYPFFLQEWGFQAWNAAPGRTIPASIIPRVTKAAIERLDKNFFKSRLHRMTQREQDYVCAMAALGPGAHRSGDIADELGITVSAAAPIRGTLINKGMIYSPAHGDTAFTVPMFDAYVRRAILAPGAKATTKTRPAKRGTRKKSG
jgi:AAA ATPase domain